MTKCIFIIMIKILITTVSYHDIPHENTVNSIIA